MVCLPILFFLLFCSGILPALADDERVKKEADSLQKEWEFEVEGQVRLRGDFAWNQDFTDFTFTPGRREGQFLERSRVQVSLESKTLNLEAVAQGQWYGRWGGRDERSDFDLYQGYVAWEKALGLPISLKAGRQELSYGSAFFLGQNDSYNGLSWDGLKVSVDPAEQFDIDILGAKMAKLNNEDPGIYLAGVYATYQIDKERSVEGYLFYNKGGFPLFHREFEFVDSGQRWFTLGARIAGKIKGFDYELEPQFQWGRVREVAGDGKDRVRAYGGHIELGYSFKFPWETRVFGAYARGSGDNKPFDGTYTEFHGTVFTDTYLTGDMNVIADLSGLTVNNIRASGIRVAVGGITVNPLTDLSLTLRGHRFHATRGPSGFSRDLGTELDLVLSYNLMKGISFLAGLDRFLTGRFFEQTSKSKKNIDYLYLQAQVEF